MPRRRPRPAVSSDTASVSAEPVVEDAIEVNETNETSEPDAVIAAAFEAAPEPAPKRPRAVKTTVGMVETKEAPQPAVDPYVAREPAPPGIILSADEPLRLEGNDMGVEVLVTQDVYRMTFPNGARRPSYILLYPRGARVPKTLLERK